jgi:hypothetical protein
MCGHVRYSRQGWLQLDLELSFAIPTLNTGIEAWQAAQEPPEDLSNCRPEGAARTDGLLGPFGVAFLARGVELTVSYFELAFNGTTWTTRICTDVSRASLAPDTDRGVYGSMVKVDVGQGSMNMRVLVRLFCFLTYATFAINFGCRMRL